jgi:integrase
MPRVKSDYVPRAVKHASGQALVRLNGRDLYLGKYGSKSAKGAYNRLIAEWLANDRRLPNADGHRTVNEVILAYLRHAEKYYRRPDGTQTAELDCLKLALRPLRQLYGDTSADDFGPSQLRIVRDSMVTFGWVRRSINTHLSRLKHLFRWAGEHGFAKPEVYHRLLCVSGLRGGRSDATESEPVKPVPQAFIDAVLPRVLSPVQAMIQIQLLTGCRPGEVCIMRGIDLEMGDRVWVYRPESHKTQHHGYLREILIGPKCQEVIRPFLRLDLNAYLFSPMEAEKERTARMRANRKTPLWPSHVKAQRRNRKHNPKRLKKDHYKVAAYRCAIRRGCVLADKQAHQKRPEIPADQVIVPSWHPNQLRHNAATNLRKEHGIELARIILGHATGFTTEIYAEADRQQAMEVMAKIG